MSHVSDTLTNAVLYHVFSHNDCVHTWCLLSGQASCPKPVIRPGNGGIANADRLVVHQCSSEDRSRHLCVPRPIFTAALMQTRLWNDGSPLQVAGLEIQLT